MLMPSWKEGLGAGTSKWVQKDVAAEWVSGIEKVPVELEHVPSQQTEPKCTLAYGQQPDFLSFFLKKYFHFFHVLVERDT